MSTHRVVKLVILGLGVVGASLTVFATDAEAQCSTGYRYFNGVCYRVKGVDVLSEVHHTGNLAQKRKRIDATISPTDTGILFCGNRGGNQPPGQRLVVAHEQLTCSQPISPNDLVTSQQGGTAQVTCTALLDDNALALLGSLYCAKGHEALDFVPCRFLSNVEYREDSEGGTIIETARDSCSLPSCETLQWVGDTVTGRPEDRLYTCEPAG